MNQSIFKSSASTHKRYSLVVWLLVFVLFVGTAKAAEPAPANTWTFPIIWNVDEPVTWYFDLTGTKFTAGQDVYIWAWQPSEPDAGNWTNSSDFAKLKYEPTKGSMIWSMTLSPTTYFSKTVADLATFDNYFWMLLKSKDGSTVTGAFSMMCPRIQIGTFKSSGVAVQTYPANFNIDTPVSILVNTTKAFVDGIIGGLSAKETIYMESGLNKFLDAHIQFDPNNATTHAKTLMRKVSANVYKIDMIPYQYFGVDQSLSFDNLTFNLWSADGVKGTADAKGNYYLIGNTNVPVVTYFPQKFCQYDILTITRKNNEKTATSVEYAITAGTKTFEGVLSGTSVSKSVTLNLLKEIGDITNLDKIKLVIYIVKGSTKIEVYSSDLPLVPLSELQ